MRTKIVSSWVSEVYWTQLSVERERGKKNKGKRGKRNKRENGQVERGESKRRRCEKETNARNVTESRKSIFQSRKSICQILQNMIPTEILFQMEGGVMTKVWI